MLCSLKNMQDCIANRVNSQTGLAECPTQFNWFNQRTTLEVIFKQELGRPLKFSILLIYLFKLTLAKKRGRNQSQASGLILVDPEEEDLLSLGTSLYLFLMPPCKCKQLSYWPRLFHKEMSVTVKHIICLVAWSYPFTMSVRMQCIIKLVADMPLHLHMANKEILILIQRRYDIMKCYKSEVQFVFCTYLLG